MADRIFKPKITNQFKDDLSFTDSDVDKLVSGLMTQFQSSQAMGLSDISREGARSGLDANVVAAQRRGFSQQGGHQLLGQLTNINLLQRQSQIDAMKFLLGMDFQNLLSLRGADAQRYAALMGSIGQIGGAAGKYAAGKL